MFKYDIPYAKAGQFTLLKDGFPINVSKEKRYLLEKMKAHRDWSCDTENDETTVKYQIVDSNGGVIYEQIYLAGERGNAKKAYCKIRTERNIERNGFNLIVDNNGNIATDEELLQFLSDFRFHAQIPCFISNMALVSMATYQPETKEEFIALKGLGEATYKQYGEIFIKAINYFKECKKSK